MGVPVIISAVVKLHVGISIAARPHKFRVFGIGAGQNLLRQGIGNPKQVIIGGIQHFRRNVHNDNPPCLLSVPDKIMLNARYCFPGHSVGKGHGYAAQHLGVHFQGHGGNQVGGGFPASGQKNRRQEQAENVLFHFYTSFHF